MIAIQWEDVIGVLQTCKPYLIALGVLWIAAVVVMIVCMKVKKKSKKRMIRKYSALSMLVSLVVIVNMIVLGPMYAMINLTTVGGTTSNETTEEAKEVAGQIAEEGMVLLKNDGILPISDPSNINLFGWSSVNPAYGGTGSGGLNDLYEKVSLIDSLTDAGFNVNQELVDFYNEFSAERAEMSLSTQNWTLTEAPASAYSDELLQSAKDFSDTAAIVLSRVAGEGHNDMPKDVTQASYDNTANGYEDFAAGEHYLQLSQTEEDLVNLVCSNFDNVIVLYNSANPMELGFVEQYDQIKAALWCQGPGNVGFEALGKILTGEVNPSGRTSDTFIYNMTAAPWWNNWEATRYSNMEDMAVEGMNSGMAQTYYPSFTNYVEGIYVGYKYYETADDDGKIDYDATVQYPFGYGLSYTTFTQEMSNLTVKDGEITFDVTVTNTGDVAGKDVVEIYYNPPYTNGGIEKATANLIDFEKTQMLEPGASETITITFDAEDMASYDMSGDGCYVLEQGDYAISVNSDSHTVLDQQIPVIPWTIVIYFGCYLVWIVNYLIAASREKEFVWRFFAADVLARLVCMAFYLLLPTTNVRPSIPEQGFWNQMLTLLYQMDAADNLFPSIHCLNSWFCYIAVRSRREIPRWYQRFSFWAALAVFVSTLTTKQHVIADVIGGALLAEVTWQIAGRTHLGAWYGMILERRRWKRRAE